MIQENFAEIEDLNLYVELGPSVPGKTDLEEVTARHKFIKQLDFKKKKKMHWTSRERTRSLIMKRNLAGIRLFNNK